MNIIETDEALDIEIAIVPIIGNSFKVSKKAKICKPHTFKEIL